MGVNQPNSRFESLHTQAQTIFVLTDDGLISWKTSMDPTREDEMLEPSTAAQYLSPADVLRLGGLIQRNFAALVAAQTRLDELFEPLASALLAIAGDIPTQLAARSASWGEVYQELRRVYMIALIAKEQSPLFAAWFNQAFTTTYKHDQQEALLFQYVRTAYYLRYPAPVRPFVPDGDEERQTNR